MTAAAWWGVGALVTSAVGAGLTYQSQRQAANTQGTLALLNAQAQTQAARHQGQAAAMQAKINEALAHKETAAANANAASLHAQAEAGTRVSQENTRRNREEMARMIALQRAQVGKAGFVDASGSPLALLSQSAEEEQRQSDAMRYEDEMTRRGLFREAVMEKNKGVLAGMQATSARISGMAAMQQATLGMSQARLDAFAGRASAAAMRSGATGQFFTSAGGLASDAFSLYRTTPRQPAIPRATAVP